MHQIWLHILLRTPRFEWYVVRCGSNHKYQKDICLKEAGLRAHNMITVLNSIININFFGGGYTYDHLISTRIFTSIMNKTFIWALKIMKKVAMALIWICSPSHTNRMFSYPPRSGIWENSNQLRPIYISFFSLTRRPPVLFNSSSIDDKKEMMSSKWVGPTLCPAECHPSLPHGVLNLCHVDDMDR